MIAQHFSRETKSLTKWNILKMNNLILIAFYVFCSLFFVSHNCCILWWVRVILVYQTIVLFLILQNRRC